MTYNDISLPTGLHYTVAGAGSRNVYYTYAERDNLPKKTSFGSGSDYSAENTYDGLGRLDYVKYETPSDSVGTIKADYNYLDVESEENRKMELAARRQQGGEVHECVDNDETAAVIANLVRAKTLVLMTSTEGIYQNPADPATLVRDVTGKTVEEVEVAVRKLQSNCVGASRAGANGARAKLEYALESVRNGTTVIIGHARHRLSDLVDGKVACTRIGVDK